jgi:threonine dehydrogenase-like Zn-dependent dehydrogenase
MWPELAWVRGCRQGMSIDAFTVIPQKAGSAQLTSLPGPVGDAKGVVLQSLCVGVCGTDREILRGDYGRAPAGEERLVLGHECVARVAEAGHALPSGTLVVPIVRRPDPVPCASCAAGEWDMCRNGRYTEHGIWGLHGFCAQQLRVDPDFLVVVPAALGRLAVLLEPASIVAKAWEHIERIGRRAHWFPERVLVTGAGPIGLLAALLGRQRGLEVTVFDRVATGRKPDLCHDLGAKYEHGSLSELLEAQPPDIVIECTGVDAVVLDVMSRNARAGIVCLVGVSSQGRKVTVDVGALNRSIVLDNDVVFGSVNANRRHYELAVAALAKADAGWLERLISRRLPLERWQDALRRDADDIKVVIDVAN